MKKRTLVFLILAVVVIVISQLPATKTISTTFKLKRYWQDNYSMIPPENTSDIHFDTKFITSAIRDECFFGVGSDRNYYSYSEIDCEDCEEQGGKPKANQSYVWSMTKGNGDLYFGTATNYLCQAMMYYSRYDSIRNDCQVCEWGASPVGMKITDNDFYGDFRPPKMYTYDPKNDNLLDITPYDDENLAKTLGIRAAGNCKDLVLFAGPGLGEEAGALSSVYFYVFNSTSKQYLGSFLLDSFLENEYKLHPNNVRRCVTINDILYVGLTAFDENGQDLGVVLRWDADPENLFDFTLVGTTPYPAADLCEHNNRIYIQSWPSVDTDIESMENPEIEKISSVIMSPEIAEEGLTEKDINSWKKVWDYSEYDPDRLTAMGYIGAAMVSFNGYLYFGNFHFPMANLHLIELQNEGSKLELLNGALATHRANAVFRCADFSVENPDVDVVCGMEKLPAWNEEKEKWEIVPNKLGKKPLSGQMGMWNPFNHYTWAMEVHDDMLFISTKSFFRTVPTMASAMGSRISNIVQKRIDNAGIPKEMYTQVDSISCPGAWLGADLFALTKNSDELIPVTTTGFDNPFNYGVRNIISIGDNLFAGTANPYNLSEDGGYELYEIKVVGE